VFDISVFRASACRAKRTGKVRSRAEPQGTNSLQQLCFYSGRIVRLTRAEFCPINLVVPAVRIHSARPSGRNLHALSVCRRNWTSANLRELSASDNSWGSRICDFAFAVWISIIVCSRTLCASISLECLRDTCSISCMRWRATVCSGFPPAACSPAPNTCPQTGF
jgi:hypothetical protein